MSCRKDTSIGRYVSILYRYGQSFLERKLNPYSIGSGQFIFLVVLFQEDGITQENLSRLLNIDKGTTARAVKKLEETGYVRRKTDPKDNRARIVYLTEEGLKLQPVVKGISEKWTEMLTADFTDSEKEMAVSFLKKMSLKAAEAAKGPQEVN